MCNLAVSKRVSLYFFQFPCLVIAQHETQKENDSFKITLKTGIFSNGLSHGCLFYFVLGLQPRDKAAMLGANTTKLFLEEFT